MLYFALYGARSNGCAVVAYDLKTGDELWKRRLEGVGFVSHSAYVNYVNLEANDYCVAIFGHESYGDYLEVLDAKSGKLIANKVFRKGYKR